MQDDIFIMFLRLFFLIGLDFVCFKKVMKFARTLYGFEPKSHKRKKRKGGYQVGLHFKRKSHNCHRNA